MRGLLGVLIAACVCIGSSGAAGAEDYPTRPITMIVPFPAGGATDTLARLPGFHASLWYALWAPKGTPKDIVAKLNATMTQVLFDPQVRQRFDQLGIQTSPIDLQSPEALRARQKADAERWWPIIKAASIRAAE